MPFSANDGKNVGLLVLSAHGDAKIRERDSGIYTTTLGYQGWKKKVTPDANLSFAASHGGVSFNAKNATYVLVVNDKEANTLYLIEKTTKWTVDNWTALGDGAWNLASATSKHGAVSFSTRDKVYVLVLNGHQPDGMFFIDGEGTWHADTDINGPGKPPSVTRSFSDLLSRELTFVSQSLLFFAHLREHSARELQ